MPRNVVDDEDDVGAGAGGGVAAAAGASELAGRSAVVADVGGGVVARRKLDCTICCKTEQRDELMDIEWTYLDAIDTEFQSCQHATKGSKTLVDLLLF